MTDANVREAFERSFLAGLPPEVAGRLRAEAELSDLPAGAVVYRPGDRPYAALVVRGLFRVYMAP